MAFKAIYSTEVFDEDRGITVKLPFRRNDSPNQITMCYSDPTVTFEFEIVFDVGPPVELPEGLRSMGNTILAAHILERTVREGLVQALGRDALSKVDYAAIKAAILEGVYLIDSDWGKYLKLVPDYKVDFID